MIERGEVHWAPPEPPGAAEAVKAFHSNYQALDERARALGDEHWTRPVKLYVGGTLFMEKPLGEFLWYLFFDAIHHRRTLRGRAKPSPPGVRFSLPISVQHVEEVRAW
jgi:hypothetical protein